MLTYTITLTADEVHLVGEGIASLAYSRVATLMSKIQGQINEQDTARLKAEQEANATDSSQ